jgi:hypothetical protein
MSAVSVADIEKYLGEIATDSAWAEPVATLYRLINLGLDTNEVHRRMGKLFAREVIDALVTDHAARQIEMPTIEL